MTNTAGDKGTYINGHYVGSGTFTAGDKAICLSVGNKRYVLPSGGLTAGDKATAISSGGKQYVVGGSNLGPTVKYFGPICGYDNYIYTDMGVTATPQLLLRYTTTPSLDLSSEDIPDYHIYDNLVDPEDGVLYVLSGSDSEADDSTISKYSTPDMTLLDRYPVPIKPVTPFLGTCHYFQYYSMYIGGQYIYLLAPYWTTEGYYLILDKRNKSDFTLLNRVIIEEVTPDVTWENAISDGEYIYIIHTLCIEKRQLSDLTIVCSIDLTGRSATASSADINDAGDSIYVAYYPVDWVHGNKDYYIVKYALSDLSYQSEYLVTVNTYSTSFPKDICTYEGSIYISGDTDRIKRIPQFD